ncbi:MAG: hypothetical protein NC910_03235 [Candidatus Omnitrophica bacterium]|nr:hypothetical protein [Candidatus Omnitrophota bacterium]
MKFTTEEELRKIMEMLAEADFEKAGCRVAEEGVFSVETARPLQEKRKAAGLFRKEEKSWGRCQLIIRHVEGMSIWEEFDARPFGGALLDLEKSGGVFLIHLRSARGLRIDLKVSRLEGQLQDL